MFSKLVVCDEIARLVLSQELIKLRVDAHVIPGELRSELSSCDLTTRAVPESFTDLFLVCVHSLSTGSWHLVTLSSVEVDIIGVDRRDISRVLFDITAITECVGNFRVVNKSVFLCADVIHEFFSWLHSNLLESDNITCYDVLT